MIDNFMNTIITILVPSMPLHTSSTSSSLSSPTSVTNRLRCGRLPLMESELWLCMEASPLYLPVEVNHLIYLHIKMC